MAILQKRTSTRKLPEARGLSRAPLTSAIQGKPAAKKAINIKPSLKAIPAKNASATPKIASRVAAPTSTIKTTSANANVRPTTAIAGGSGGSGSMGNVLGNAAKGAVLGLGAGMLYDKLTGKPTKSSGASGSTAGKNPATAPAPAKTAPAKPIPAKPVKPVAEKPVKPVKPAPAKPAPITSKVVTPKEKPSEEPKEEPVEEKEEETPEETGEEETGEDTGEDTGEEEYTEEEEYEEEEPYEEEEYYEEEEPEEYEEEVYEERKGGLISMMKQGGVPHYAVGTDEEDFEEEEEIPEDDEELPEDDEEEEFEITPKGSYNPETGEFIDTTLPDEDEEKLPSDEDTPIEYNDNGDGTASYWDGDEYVTVDSNSGEELYRTNENGEPTTIQGQMDYEKQKQESEFLERYRNPSQIQKTPEGPDPTASSFMDAITNNLGAAGAGALIASLLGGDFGGSGGQNQGVDMSKIGVLNPRTTDFGIGPTRYVGYEDYGVEPDFEYTPNEELLTNLNAPGFNPVNEGDYGYEDVADNSGLEDIQSDMVEEPRMASGGLSAMGPTSQTHYTFGKPADVYANLGLREAPIASPVDAPRPITPPQQSQQGQPPQGGLPKPPMGGMPPQGMPQGSPQGMTPAMPAQMPPAMRKGGLPHASNVPMVDGRYDFRNGSAVHGEGDGQSDDIPAMLADGEYVIDAETVAQIGNGSTKAGAQALDKFRESIRAHKRSAPLNKIPPKTKVLTSYLKGAK